MSFLSSAQESLMMLFGGGTVRCRNEYGDLERPKKIEFFDHGSDIEIARRWFDWLAVVATPMAVLWDREILNIYFRAAAGAPMTASMLIIAAAGIGFTYYVLARWLNRTHILVSREKIVVHHRPLPWPGNVELDASKLRGVYTVEKAAAATGAGASGPVYWYELRAKTDSKEDTSLLNLFTPESALGRRQALYIEQEIRKYLRLPEWPNVAKR